MQKLHIRHVPLALFALATSAGTAAAQSRVLRAELHAELARDAMVRVSLGHTLSLTGEETTIPLAALGFGGANLDDVRATSAGVPLPLELSATQAGARRTGTLLLPPQLRRAGELQLDVVYEVQHPAVPTGEARIRIPVLAVLWPPARASAGTFAATVTLPDSFFARDAFPTALREVRARNGIRSYRADTQVVPAMVSFRLTAGRPWLELATLLDAGLIVLLLLFGLGFRRHLRKSS